MNSSPTSLRILAFACVALLWLGACKNPSRSGSEQSDSAPTTQPDQNMEMTKQPYPTDNEFKAGPSILPAEDLIAFFEAPHEGLVKAPVVVRFGDDFPRPIVEAYFGVDADMEDGEKVLLELNDGEMGIPMRDHFQDLCPDGEICKVWLLGHWGENMDLGLPEMQADPDAPKTWPFAVRGVFEEGPEAPESNGEARIWVKR